MAINPEITYPGKINPSSAGYPYGEPRNVNVNGDGTGTPWEAQAVKDLFGFQQAILNEAGIVPSNVPDNANNSQYLNGIKTIAEGLADVAVDGIDPATESKYIDATTDIVNDAIDDIDPATESKYVDATTDIVNTAIDDIPKVNNITTQELINSVETYPVNTVVQTTGYHSSGDGGGGKWIITGNTIAVSQTPFDLNEMKISDASGREYELYNDGTINVLQSGFVGNGTADDTMKAQAVINTLVAKGGGELVFPQGNWQLFAIYDNDRTNLPAGYVPNDEMRRANKALIIYEADNITIRGVGGAIIDRSNDIVADPTYSSHSSTFYISKSRNVVVKDLEILGAQDDDQLLLDNKDVTSGTGVFINNGCNDCTVTNCIFQDGTNGIAVGVNRTSSFQALDPALEDCKNIKLSDITVRNNEHFLLLAAADGIELSNISGYTYNRGSGDNGVTQRGIFFHSCRNLVGSNINLKGVFKTGLNLADYRDVYNIRLSNVHILEGLTEAEYKLRGSGASYNTSFESIGIRVDGQNDNNISNISIKDFQIGSFYSGLRVNSGNNNNLRFSNGTIDVHYIGMDNIDYTPSGPANPQADYYLDNLKFNVIRDLVNFPDATLNAGIYLKTDAAGTATGLNLHSCYIKSENRCGRVVGFDGNLTGNTFEYVSGLAGSRAYDLNISEGSNWLSGNTFVSEDRYNKGQDTPAAIDTVNVHSLNDDNSSTVKASATPVLNSEMVFELTNDTTLTVKVKGTDGTIRSNTLTLT